MRLSLDELLEIYPWETKYNANAVSRVDWLWVFELDISVDALWSYVSDTSKLNKAMGLSEMSFEEKQGSLYGKSSNLGIRLEWREIPWTWVYGKYLISIREYEKGFATTVKVIYHFEKLSDTSTRFYVYLGWLPRSFFYKLLLGISEKFIYKKYDTVLSEIVSSAKAKFLIPDFQSKEKESKLENKAVIFKITEELLQNKISSELITKLLEHIEYGNELDLYRIRVLELAKKWNVNSRELLVACMYATRAGLLTISWDVICPHCRGTRLESTSLYEVPKKASCDVCDVEFENESENSIEITFHVHPSIRNVAKVFYCSAEPAKKPHIKLQKILSPHETIAIDLSLGIGTYRLRVKGKEKTGTLLITDAENTNQVNWNLEDNHNYTSGLNPLIRISNTEDIPLLCSIEEISWDPFALKPAYLFSLQEFHDLFSAESISSELKLELGLQTIFFTDIVGSSTLYESQGDSKTFLQVKRHFEEINKLIKENEGAIIKTIGDAVMATFPSPSGAVQVAMQLRKIFDGNKMGGIRLRMSMHYGQCIAVNLNSGIDYFGKTVNIAAKIQKLAGASQVVFTKEYREVPDVNFFLESNGIALEELKFTISGMKEEFTIFRINA